MSDVLTGPNSDEALYPEHEKMKQIASDSQAIGEFLEVGGYVLATVDANGRLVDVPGPIEQILADYFEIDLAKVETEKREMLRQMAGD